MKNRKSNFEYSSNFVHSPFRYQGHQTYALKSILSLIPEHELFIEPFCGGAGVFFAKPKVKINWLNDINEELIKTYQVIRDKPNELINFLKKEYVSVERYNYFNKEFKPHNNFGVAIRWFYLNRTSNLETMDKFWEQDGTIKTDFSKLDKIIFDCSRKLQGTKLVHGDFNVLINEAPDNAFLVISPPYSLHHSQNRTQSYKHPFEKNDHLRIVNTLKQNTNRIKFLLTYRDCEEIKNLYSWGHNTIRELNCDNEIIKDPTKKIEDQTKKEERGKEEIAIMNYIL